MNNNIQSLKALFSDSYFNIPQYQRAYAWNIKPQLSDFLSDLRQQVKAQQGSSDKTYFLGSFLLHDKKGRIDIVDGQQRLTTSVIFVSAALKRHEHNNVLDNALVNATKLKRLFIFDEDEGRQKLKTIKEDNDFFRSEILDISKAKNQAQSQSSNNLKEAQSYFLQEVNDDEWVELIGILTHAQTMTYVVNNPADATQIFELQNDRGKSLTELESIKSFLMHMVYLHDKSPDDRLDCIQTQFSRIYRSVEGLRGKRRVPDEDALLSYHCAAFCNWTGEEWRRPKELIKNLVHQMDNEQIPEWIEKFVSDMVRSYESVVKMFEQLDNYTELVDLVVLGRLAPFWPLLIKTWHVDDSTNKKDFRKAVRLMEIYSFRGYGISNLRADGGQSTLYTMARDFKDFEVLHNTLYDMCYWYDLEKRFENGLDAVKLYKSNRSDTQYLLWKYENSLRSKKGNKQPQLSWKDYLLPKSDATKFSVEHIAAQSHEIANTEIKWEEDGEVKKFSEIAMHRLGNLVLDSVSTNSSKGKKDFTDKLKQLSETSIYISQGELINFAHMDEGTPKWTVNSIKARHESLIEFAKQHWNPEKCW